MKLERSRFLWLALAVASIAAAMWLLFGGKEQAPAAVQPSVPGIFRPTKAQWANLSAEPVQAMAFRTEIITEGNLAYDDDATTQVFSPYTGRVTRIYAQLGTAVRQGQPLMAVAATEFVQARSDLINAGAQLNLAKASESRQHALYLAKSGALKDWLQSKADLAAAESNLQAARAKLQILGKSDGQIRELEQGKGGAESLLLSPISGTVIQRQIGLGQYINSAAGGAASPVYTIGNLSKLWMIANVREADAPSVRVGQSVEVRIAAYPGRVYKAKVTWVAPAIDPATRRLPVRAEVENPDGTLKAMMFANFDIIVGKESLAPGVPKSAIVYEGDETRVYVVKQDGTIAIRNVVLGRTRQDGMVEVTSGLAPGEKIITGGTLFIDRAVSLAMKAGQ
jgi:cobalt-zinc-cadmium efflux system membrane fusion protein